MKMDMIRVLGFVAVTVLGAVTMVGCGRKSETPGIAERTGVALDKAAEKTGEAVKNAAAATKEGAGVVVEKTGEVVEKAGAAVEKAGADIQK